MTTVTDEALREATGGVIRFERTPTGLSLHWRWLSSRKLAMQAASLVVCTFLLTRPFATGVLPVMLLLGGTGAYALYYVLTQLLNQTTVTVDEQGVRVAHGPLPWFKGGQVSRADLKQIIVKRESYRSVRKARSIEHNVSVETHDGQRRELVNGPLTSVGPCPGRQARARPVPGPPGRSRRQRGLKRRQSGLEGPGVRRHTAGVVSCYLPRAMATIGFERTSLRGAGLVMSLVSLPLLSGCASFPRVAKAPLEPPTSEGGSLSETSGVRLYSATWLPDTDPVGVIYFVVGPEVGSAEPYPTFSAAARAAGFALAMVHPRGSGYSDGVRGDIEDYRLFLADLNEGLERLRARFPSKPIFLFGHSAGATLALEVGATSRTRPAGLVLVNPAYKLVSGEGMGPSWSDYLVYGINFVFRASALTVDMNSRPSAIEDAADRAEAEAMQRDPLVVRYFSMRFLSAQKKVMDRCVANASATDAPMLLIQGAHDALVDPTGNDEILAAAATTDKVKLTAPNGGHGSSSVETMVAELLQWLRRIASSPRTQ